MRTATTRWKVWLFRAGALLALYGLLEGASLAVFRYRTGGWFSFAAIHREQGQIEAWTFAARPQERGTYLIHPYLGLVANPEGPQDPDTHPANRFGFHDAHPPAHRRGPGKVIVGVVGGSVANIFARQGAETLREELRRAPAFAGKEVVLVNLAVNGHKQPQQVMALEYALARGGEFDIVVNLDGFNEVALYPADNWADGVDPLFPRSWHHQVMGIPEVAVREQIGEMAYYHKERGRWARRFARSPLRYSVTANLVWSIRDKRLHAEEARCLTALLGHRWADLPLRAVGPERPPADRDAVIGQLVGIWERCSLQLHRTCRGHGIEYYHFLQPNQYVPGSKPMGPEEQELAVAEGHPYRLGVEAGYPLLRETGRELTRRGVRFHDLTMAFREHAEPFYYDSCCHFNRGGNEVLARAIAAALAETAEPPLGKDEG